MTLDPLPREVVRNDDDERFTFELSCRRAVEPRLEGGVVQGVPEPRGNFGPQQFRAQLYRTIHPLDSLLDRLPGSGDYSSANVALQRRRTCESVVQKPAVCRDSPVIHNRLHNVENSVLRGSTSPLGPVDYRTVENVPSHDFRPSLYWLRSPGAASSLGLIREANLSTERPPEEAPARVPRENADPGRPRDPEAPPCQGTQAPFRLRRRPRGA